MMRLPSIGMVLRQVLKKPATNLFPAKHLPPSITGFLESVTAGKTSIIPPIATPNRYRGIIQYDRDSCIGCRLCIRVCPSHAIEFLPETKRIRIYVTNCIYCSQCNDVCSSGSLQMGSDFLLATEDRFSEAMIVE